MILNTSLTDPHRKLLPQCTWHIEAKSLSLLSIKIVNFYPLIEICGGRKFRKRCLEKGGVVTPSRALYMATYDCPIYLLQMRADRYCKVLGKVLQNVVYINAQ